MDRLTNKKEADAQREAYERRLKQGYPKNIPEERYLKLAAYEDTGLSPEELDNLCRQMSEIRTSLGFKTLDDVYKLVSEGRLIVLPCKVGDKFYLIDKLCNKLPGLCNYGGRCSDCEGNKPFISECSVQTLPQAVAILDAVGKTVFLTREEAEKALEAHS